jgi:hypothetical protein
MKNLLSNAQRLSTTEMNSTKGGSTSIVITASLDICLVDPTTGTTSLLYCDRRKKRVGQNG